jgi:hypothetical protein
MVAKKKPELIKIGKHYINVSDVAQISKVRSGDRQPLYVVKLFSNPNPEFPIWVTKHDEIEFLLSHFEILSSDNEDEDN